MFKLSGLLFVLFFSFSNCEIMAQSGEGKISPRKANDAYSRKNYTEALTLYKYLITAEPKNIEYQFRIGVCYLNTNINKGQATSYFQTVIDLDKLDQKTDYAIAYYLLGRALHYDYKFDKAIAAFEKFLTFPDITEEDIGFTKQKIQFCYNAIEIIKYPLDVTFQNMGEHINSEYPDYFPFVPADESFLIYNSKRDDKSERIFDGSFASNVYLSRVKNGEFRKAKILDGPVNTKTGNEDVIGLSANGREALFFIDNEDDYGQIFIGQLLENQVRSIEKISSEISSTEPDIAASINTNGDVMYIASQRKGGYGGTDIYVARKLPNGKWGEVMNLGPEINTPHNEDFPTISPDEKTLYFSSEGHTSMGGLDIFKAEWDPRARKWINVRNLGYPINTPEDNMNFRVSSNGKHGYISALRAEGYGDMDIYRVNFNSVEPRYTVITGKLYAVNTTQIFEDVFITVTEEETGEIYGSYLPNSISGKYVIILPPGKFNVQLEVEGFEEVEEPVEILDKSDFRSYIEQDLVLKPKGILKYLPQIEEE